MAQFLCPASRVLASVNHKPWKEVTLVKETTAKKRIAKVLAPIADTTARNIIGVPCSFIFHQPKLPKKLMSKVK